MAGTLATACASAILSLFASNHAWKNKESNLVVDPIESLITASSPSASTLWTNSWMEKGTTAMNNTVSIRKSVKTRKQVCLPATPDLSDDDFGQFGFSYSQDSAEGWFMVPPSIADNLYVQCKYLFGRDLREDLRTAGRFGRSMELAL